ncbi:BTB/POZ domain-containing protein 6-like isoform X2 [Oratosquilla oratoria]|uniref:BTB/POZ domain-containing protein 6-like isoform X2 n=1 Tax=Oratosquilla oratoria TaxID=337810 RepID=UPI003F76EC9B
MKLDSASFVFFVGLLRSVTSSSFVDPLPQASAWQNNFTSLNERFQYLLTSAQYSDLTIVFPKDDKRVAVHSLVLAASSPVFGSLLMGPSSVGSELTVQDSYQSFAKLLEYMYHDKMDLQSVDEALRVYASSYKYQVHSASNLCSQYVINHLTKETILAALEASVDFADEELRNKCVTMLNLNVDEVLSPASVIKLKRKTLKGLLLGELLVSSETLLFDSVLAWGRAQLSERGEEISSIALRKETEDLLKEVRFLTMTCKEFTKSVLPTDIFKPDESIHLLRASQSANISLVPESIPFSPSTKNRGRSVDTLIKEKLYCSSQSGGGSYSTTIYASSQWTIIVNNVKSADYIFVHSLHTPYDSEVRIQSQDGTEDVSISFRQNFTFLEPFLLSPDKYYTVSIRSSKNLSIKIVSRQHTVVQTTLSGKLSHCLLLEFWFWKP